MNPADIANILDLVMKAVGVIEVLVNAGVEAAPAFTILKNLVTGAQAGTVTDDQLSASETALDAMIADFNEPM